MMLFVIVVPSFFTMFIPYVAPRSEALFVLCRVLTGVAAGVCLMVYAYNILYLCCLVGIIVYILLCFHIVDVFLICINFLNQATFPTMFLMMSGWLPFPEKATSLAIVFSGVNIGTIIIDVYPDPLLLLLILFYVSLQLLLDCRSSNYEFTRLAICILSFWWCWIYLDDFLVHDYCGHPKRHDKYSPN